MFIPGSEEGNPSFPFTFKILSGLLFHILSINYSLVNIYDEEKQLLAALVANDRLAIEKIYRDIFPVIHGFIIKNNGYTDDARDVFQEALIILFEKAKHDTFQLTCQLKTYIYSVCRRMWLKKLQRENRFFDISDVLREKVSVEEDMEEHQKQTADMKRLEDSLFKLGQPCKGIIESYYLNKMSMPEIAELFGYTNADNAKTQKYKCLVRLKKIFFSQDKNGK